MYIYIMMRSVINASNAVKVELNTVSIGQTISYNNYIIIIYIIYNNKYKMIQFMPNLCGIIHQIKAFT